MRRADRLFTIVHMLRGGRHVTARRLAERLEVSQRTIYRDVDELTLCGVPIEGTAGLGFRLPETFEIPPLMFERHEIEALVAGCAWRKRGAGPGLRPRRAPRSRASGRRCPRHFSTVWTRRRSMRRASPGEPRRRISRSLIGRFPKAYDYRCGIRRTTEAEPSASFGRSACTFGEKSGRSRPGAKRATTSGHSGSTASESRDPRLPLRTSREKRSTRSSLAFALKRNDESASRHLSAGTCDVSVCQKPLIGHCFHDTI